MPTRNPNDIRTEIERTREEIAQSLASLRSSVTEAADWHTYVRRSPRVFLGAAFALGLVLGIR